MKKFVIFLVMVSFIVPFLTAQQNNMVRIEGGTFTMGSPANETGRYENEIQRQVTVSAFWMSIYEVTQKEYQYIMGYNPSRYKGDNLPVESVSWFDAIEYCNKLSQKEGLTPVYTITERVPSTGYPIRDATVTVNWNNNGYRLPTEAEWEYACRAGTTTPFFTGDNITANQANYNSYERMTVPVGKYEANAWGLYDILGNIIEWCWDWYGDYPASNQINPVGATTGTSRVLRGGGWGVPPEGVRSACRYGDNPAARSIVYGFRVVQNKE